MTESLLLGTAVSKNIPLFKENWIIYWLKPIFSGEHLICYTVGVSDKKTWKPKWRKYIKTSILAIVHILLDCSLLYL